MVERGLFRTGGWRFLYR